MKSPLYLVTGATGITGGHTVNSLLSAHAPVRAFVPREDERSEALKQRGVELIVGDINDFRSVRRALSGVTGAYFCYPISEGIVKATAQFSQAAKEQEVSIVVNMSQVIARGDARSNASLQHWIAERVFDWSGVPVAHIRPTFFMEWLFYMAPMIQAGTIYAPYGSGKTALISGEDQGRVIAEILQHPERHIGEIYPLYGPTEYTFAEIAELIGKTLGRTIGYQQVPFQKMIEGIETRSQDVGRNSSMNGYAETSRSGSGGESFLAQHLREAVEDHHAGLFAGTNDAVQRITGCAPMSIQEFVNMYRPVFEPPMAMRTPTV